MKIEINNLRFTYPTGLEALRGISLTIESGEQVAIVGQNGAGKTTLVRHFNGLLQPTVGSVLIGDWDVKKYSVAKLASRVGYVFQNPDEQLFSKDVGTEVKFGPRNLGYSKEKTDELVKRALALTELSDKTETNPYDLSPTWRKMVALASVIAMDTPIVIFDEPTTGQDALSIARIAHVIAELRKEGKTVVTITHDIDFCAENFERVIALSNGQVLLDGTATDVLGQEEILAQTYVDPPQLTRLGKKLGFKDAVRNQEEFLMSLRGASDSERRSNLPINEEVASGENQGHPRNDMYPNKVSVQNIPAYRHLTHIPVAVDGKTIHGDVAYGGNWFFLCHDHGLEVNMQNLEALTDFSWRVREQFTANGITGANGAEIDHVELFASTPDANADSKSFVLCPGKAYDRSPCGTGTSAKLACLYDDGKLQVGQIWKQQSVVGSIFEGSIQIQDNRIIPTITGEAWVMSEGTILVDDRDPFGTGI